MKSFPGATVEDMKSYVIPSKNYNNDLAIFHCGSNDLRCKKSALQIANDVTSLALDFKTNENDVMISALVARSDMKNMNDKGMEVNKFLRSNCEKHKLHFIHHSNIRPQMHLNSSGLHLNDRGTYILGSDFVRAIQV